MGSRIEQPAAATYGCLEAKISPFGTTYRNASGVVRVCFDGALRDERPSGTLDMDVTGLGVNTTGGVHVHNGEIFYSSCFPMHVGALYLTSQMTRVNSRTVRHEL